MDYPARTPEQLGQILRALRLGRSMPQTELATDSGLLQKTISLLERAPERATVETLMRAIAALDADLVIRLKDLHGRFCRLFG